MAAVKGQDLWNEALQTLHEEDKTRYQQLLVTGADCSTIVADVLDATLQKKEECVGRRWKVQLQGKTIIVRDLLERVTIWVNKFVAVGDSAIQYDPGHAALPWAAVRFILKATIVEIEIFGAILQTVQGISSILTRCVITECLYVGSSSATTKHLRDRLVALYASILHFLSKSMGYFSRGTTVRVVKSMVTNLNEIEAWSKPIYERQAEVDRLTLLANAESSGKAVEMLNQLQSGQDSQEQLLIQNYKALQDMSVELRRPITRIDDRLSKMQDQLERSARASILKSISGFNAVAHHKVANANLLIGSGKWLLEQPRFQGWRDESCSSVLWLHGIPGSGKTKLASMVVNEIRNISPIAYFYCIRNPAEPKRAECDAILLSLVRQLASLTPGSPILPPVLSRYRDAVDGFVDFSDISWTNDEITQCLIELCDLYPTVTFVLDALDEANPENRLDLLDSLLQTMDESQVLVKIFITSRENMDIFARLSQVPNIRISAHDNTEDITKFVHERLHKANLLNGRLSDSLKDDISQKLIHGARGMFRWVDLQIQSLRPLKVPADIELRLGRLPQSLEDSYSEIMNQIESSGENAHRLATFTFQWLLYGYRQFTVHDFARLASSHQAQQSAPVTGFEILDVCQNFVSTDDEDNMSFAHLSVREYLENQRSEQRQKTGQYQTSLSSARGNAEIARACISYLRSNLENGLNLSLNDDFEVLPYTANYWPEHVIHSGQSKYDSTFSSDVVSFMISEDEFATSSSDGVPIVISEHECATSFDLWCRYVRNHLKYDASWKVLQAVKLKPSNPIWLAHSYRIVDIDPIAFRHREMLSSALAYAMSKDDETLDEVRESLLNQCRGRQKVSLSFKEHKRLVAGYDFSWKLGDVAEYYVSDVGFHIKEIGLQAMKAAIDARRVDRIEFLVIEGYPVDFDWLLRVTSFQDPWFLDRLVKNVFPLFDLDQLKWSFFALPVERLRKLFWSVIQSGVHPVLTSILMENETEMGFHAVVYSLGGGVIEIDYDRRDGSNRLIDAGFTIHGTGPCKRTALHYAVQANWADVVRKLLAKNTNVDAQDDLGRTPLHSATGAGHTAIVRMLLAHGADGTLLDHYGHSPLHIAARQGHEAIVSMLLDHGVDMDGLNSFKQSPLHVAAEYSHATIVRMLCDRNCDASIKDIFGRTPLDYETIHPHEEINKILKSIKPLVPEAQDKLA